MSAARPNPRTRLGIRYRSLRRNLRETAATPLIPSFWQQARILRLNSKNWIGGGKKNCRKSGRGWRRKSSYRWSRSSKKEWNCSWILCGSPSRGMNFWENKTTFPVSSSHPGPRTAAKFGNCRVRTATLDRRWTLKTRKFRIGRKNTSASNPNSNWSSKVLISLKDPLANSMRYRNNFTWTPQNWTTSWTN